MFYSTKMCPHCGKAYTFMQPSKQVTFGSPFRSCDKCGGKFIDKSFVELAYLNNNKYKPKKIYPGSILYFCIGIIGIVFSIVNFDGFNVATAASIFFVLIGLFFIISDITDYNKDLDYYNKELEESRKRLSYVDYLTKLKQLYEEE